MEGINEKLIKLARATANRINLNGYHDNRSGTVGCALLAKNGKIYSGVNIHTACDLGFCAEAAAIAEMLKDGETIIDTIVASTYHGEIRPPCGRCREFMCQVDRANLNTRVIIDNNTIKTVDELLPHNWVSITKDN
ncbi:MAG: cytidine deaminase [Alphaproteobacteria bacterium]|nr:cytidine deaminase [Alphaproteobacteria bacterium]